MAAHGLTDRRLAMSDLTHGMEGSSYDVVDPDWQSSTSLACVHGPRALPPRFFCLTPSPSVVVLNARRLLSGQQREELADAWRWKKLYSQEEVRRAIATVEYVSFHETIVRERA